MAEAADAENTISAEKENDYEINKVAEVPTAKKGWNSASNHACESPGAEDSVQDVAGVPRVIRAVDARRGVRDAALFRLQMASGLPLQAVPRNAHPSPASEENVGKF